MQTLEMLYQKVCNAGMLRADEALQLAAMPVNDLCAKANRIRAQFCGTTFDLCTIVNGKSGNCSEDCAFCAQSAHAHTGIKPYSLMLGKTIIADAARHAAQGVPRYSIVTAGKRLSDAELAAMCDTIRQIRLTVDISLCVSFGLLSFDQFRALKQAGVTRIHNNLETSRRYFPQICTTHTFDDKIASIRAAQDAGLTVCSGGIMGIGETMEDRIDMALTLRDLGIQSVPINILNPIAGTPMAHRPLLNYNELRTIIAIFRFILPGAVIRLAGGRGLLQDQGKACFCGGANAAITGDMLTTAGISVATDINLLKNLGFKVVKQHG